MGIKEKVPVAGFYAGLAFELAKISPKELKELVQEAQELRAASLKGKIPAKAIQNLQDIWRAYRDGQTLICNVNLPLTISVTIQAEHEYGHPKDWSVGLQDGATKLARDFWEHFADPIKDRLIDDPFVLETLVPGAGEACDKESANYKKFRKVLDQFEDDYEVEASPYLKD